MGFFEPTPNHTDAYHKDSSNHEYFGKALKGITTAMAGWQIYKMEYTGNNWVIKYPNGSSLSQFVWDDVESYTYLILGTKA